MNELGAPDTLFSGTARALRDAFSPTRSAAAWKDVGASINKQTNQDLSWAAWVLSKFDEPDVTDELIESLRALVTEQTKTLADATLPWGLRELIERQVRSMEAALRLYNIQGVTPLQEAVKASIGELATASPDLVHEVEKGPPEVRAALQGYKKVLGKAAEIADKGSKVIKFGHDIYEIATTAAPYIQGLLSSGPPGA